MHADELAAAFQVAAQYARLYHQAATAWWALLALGATCLAVAALLDARDHTRTALSLHRLTTTHAAAVAHAARYGEAT